MKHLKGFQAFARPIQESTGDIHNTRISKVCEFKVPDPEHGDFRLSVFPFENTGQWVSLPKGFEIWEQTFNDILKKIPLQEGANTHYLTIDSKFFTKAESLRREGIHADGNFCVDPNFVTQELDEKATWGGASPKPTWGGSRLKPKLKSPLEAPLKSPSKKRTWGGASPKPTWGGSKIRENAEYVVKEDNSHVQMDWVLPYNIIIPIGDYISEEKGGIFCASSEFGCQGWQGQFVGEVLSEGDYSDMLDQLTEDKKVLFEANNLYFMTSNTPHETLLVDKGKRRTLMRVTLNHEYLNKNLNL